MMKTFTGILLFVLILPGGALFAQPVLITAQSATVDGIYENSVVLITGRNPRFSWEFTYDAGANQDSFVLWVGTIDGGSDVWSVSKTIPPESILEYIIYAGAVPLAAGTTYYWSVMVTDDALLATDSAWASSFFHTSASAVPVPSDSIVLFVDWNNPFNPSVGEFTKIRYGINDSSEQLKLRVYSITGELIVTLAEHLGLEDSVYTANWDGRNAEGKVVSSGVYYVNLEAGDSKSEITRVVVLK